MVPSIFVFLHRLPLTNGKLDDPASDSRSRPAATWIHPTSARVMNLNGSWSRCGKKFWMFARSASTIISFDLGGHSLAGARIISEVHRRYGMELPLQALFESPTIAQLAGDYQGWLEKENPGGGQRVALSLSSCRRGGVEGRCFFSPAGGRQRAGVLYLCRASSSPRQRISRLRLAGEGR